MFRDATGKLSMMRVGFFVTLALGVLLCGSGAVAVFYGAKDAAVLVTIGGGMITSGGWAKAVQTKWERTDVAVTGK